MLAFLFTDGRKLYFHQILRGRKTGLDDFATNSAPSGVGRIIIFCREIRFSGIT